VSARQGPVQIEIGQCLIFSLDEHHYGVRIAFVTRVIHVVEITPLPDAPGSVLGIFNLGGIVVPVISLRRRFKLPERAGRLGDRLIIAHASRSSAGAGGGRMVALAADAVIGVRDFSGQESFPADSILPGQENLEGLARTDLGIVLIYDLAMFLSLDDEGVLASAMGERGR
jgi:purine-binding chemotaxis protein CheW